MKAIKFIFATVILSSVLFVSCSPSSVADEDSIYDNQGIDRTTIKVPTNG